MGILEQTSGKLKRPAAARVIVSKSILPTSSLSFFIRLNSRLPLNSSLSRLCPFFPLSATPLCSPDPFCGLQPLLLLSLDFLRTGSQFGDCHRSAICPRKRDSQFGGCLTGDSLPDVSPSVDHSLMTLTPPRCDPAFAAMTGNNDEPSNGGQSCVTIWQ